MCLDRSLKSLITFLHYVSSKKATKHDKLICWTLLFYSKLLPLNIKWENEAKYLGMVIDKRVTLKQHVEYVSDRAHTAFRLVYPPISRNSQLDVRNKLLIYKLAIRPIEYVNGCPAFESMAKTHLKKLQVLKTNSWESFLTKQDMKRSKIYIQKQKYPPSRTPKKKFPKKGEVWPS